MEKLKMAYLVLFSAFAVHHGAYGKLYFLLWVENISHAVPAVICLLLHVWLCGAGSAGEEVKQ